jgi:hypothetical protein
VAHSRGEERVLRFPLGSGGYKGTRLRRGRAWPGLFAKHRVASTVDHCVTVESSA